MGPSPSSASQTPNPTSSSSIRLRDRYSASLRSLSARTGTPLPSLITSFAILHELTAIIPFVGIFYACRTTGLGESAANVAVQYTERRRAQDPDVWVGRWMDEGERWAERVGRRYGIFGYAKGRNPDDEGEGRKGGMSDLAGDGANALVAYCLTKALLPARLGLSMYLSPSFSRRLLDPVGRTLLSWTRRSKAS